MKKALLPIIVVLPFLLLAQEEPDTAIYLKEFEIVDTRRETNPYSTEYFDEMKMRSLPVRDVGDLLRSTPNISGIRKGGISIDPVMRGFKFSQINVQLNNGQKIEGGCPNRMDHPAAHIDPDDIREMEIIKGPYALRYGPNFGGIINMKTLKPLTTRKFTVKAGALLGYESNWNGLKQQVYINGGNRKLFFRLTANHKDYGNYTDGNGNEVSSSFKRYNISGQAGVALADGHRIVTSIDQSYGRDVMFPALPMDERTDDTRLMSLDYIGELSKTINHLHFKAYHSDVNHLMDNKQRPFSDTVVAESLIRAINYGFRAEAGIWTGKCQLYVGADMENIEKDGERTKYFILQPTLPVKKEALWDNAYIRNLGFFAEHRKSFGDLSLVSAIRLDFNHATSNDLIREANNGNPVYQNDSTTSNHVNFSLSVGADYRLSDKLSLNLALGRGVRSPDMSERFIILLPIGYDPYDYLGNPNLKPEVNYQADLGLKFSDREKVGSAKLNFFYSYVDYYIAGVLIPESQVKPQTKGVLGVKEFRNLGNVHLAGFEATWSSPEKFRFGWQLMASYTYGVNPEAIVYLKEGGEVIDESIEENDPLPEIPPLEGSINLFYKFLDNRLVPSLNLRLVAPQDRISVALEETETPGFAVADFRLGYTHNEHLSIHAGVNNIFDKGYYEHLNRRLIGTKGNFYEPGRTWYITMRFEI